VSGTDEDYIYDDDSGEWLPASELAARQTAANSIEVRDAVGNLLADGDQVTLIKDLEVKGAGQTLKQAYRRPAGNRLPLSWHQRIGVTRRICPETFRLTAQPPDSAAKADARMRHSIGFGSHNSILRPSGSTMCANLPLNSSGISFSGCTPCSAQRARMPSRSSTIRLNMNSLSDGAK
jgi:hypothetical protein